MRFVENGPNIPDELLESRDNGEVVFICGAGVSIPAGLPSFTNLAKQVVSNLGVSKDAKPYVLLERALSVGQDDFAPPMDQVFNLLKNHYGSQLVEEAVFKRLGRRRGASVIHHEAILNLSADANGNPRLVTTNFDLMFEAARKGLKKYIAPELPDFSAVREFEGIVYLHGRMPTKGSRRTSGMPVILSSSDFGRAYLSQGWAARFVRDLLQRFTVVLLGYSASDPPVRYLLEGLGPPGLDFRHRIFAFDNGTPEEVDARWRDRNVRGIAYLNEDGTHQSLWKSLHAWAARAKDPTAWRKSIVALSKKGPVLLAAHERGQVVSLVSSTKGARLFSEEQDPAPPDWINVFDYNLRYAEPFEGSDFGERMPAFDSLAVYGLDSDLPRSAQDHATSGMREPKRRGIDVLAVLPGDESRQGVKRVSNISSRQADQLLQRLFHLVRWIARQAHTPTMTWWAGRQQTLHRVALEHITWRLRDKDIVILPVVRAIWDLLIELHESQDADGFDQTPFELKAKVTRAGWSESFLRDFEAFLRPRLSAGSRLFSPPYPFFPENRELKPRDIVKLEVSFPTWPGVQWNIPEQYVPVAFKLARRGLERASRMMMEIDEFKLHTATFYPEEKPGEVHHDARNVYFLWVGKLFARFCAIDPKGARAEFYHWPEKDEYHFDKLKLFVLANEGAFDSSIIAEHLLSIGAEIFWRSDHRRELLILLQRRWSDFSATDREEIVGKILVGPTRWENEMEKDYVRRKARDSLAVLGWLRDNACDLPTYVDEKLATLRKEAPEWKTSWSKFAADSLEGRTGWVEENTTYESLASAGLCDVIDLARKHSARPFAEFTDYRPFKGLLLARPFRAISALVYEARRGSFPLEFWQEAISGWPDRTTIRLRWFFARHVACLPPKTIKELRHYIPSWIEKHLPGLAELDQERALAIWDRVLDALIESGPEATESGVGEIVVGGKKVARSRRTFQFSHGPIGSLSGALFVILDRLKLPQSAKIPIALKTRLERLWNVPGEGAGHAISQLGSRLLWLDYLDPDWTREKLLPLFAIDSQDSEPVWSGYLHQQRLPRKELFQQIRSDFIMLGSKFAEWGWGENEQRQYAFLVVLACWWNTEGGAYLDWNATRSVLRALDDNGRQQAIYAVSKILEKNLGGLASRNRFSKERGPESFCCRRAERRMR